MINVPKFKSEEPKNKGVNIKEDKGGGSSIKGNQKSKTRKFTILDKE